MNDRHFVPGAVDSHRGAALGGGRPLALAWRMLLLGLGMGPVAAAAQESFAPSAVFAQLGASAQAGSLAAGLAWDWRKAWVLGPGRLTGYWEASLSLWSYPSADGQGRSRLGQIAVTPVFRYTTEGGDSPWFFDLGIGVTWMNTLYATDRKSFSTQFNFGDQLGFGRSFGPGGRHELSLRAIHYSNADLKLPNPGENFVQLRYALALR